MKKFFAITSLTIVLFFCTQSTTEAYFEKPVVQDSGKGKVLQVGEELLYEVSYSFIKLGEVRIKVLDKRTVNGKVLFKTIAFIDSYSGVPFVTLHQIYESTIYSDFTPEFFRGTIREDDQKTYTEYYFDRNKSRLHIKKGRVDPPKVWTDSTTSLDRPYQDGLSIFYYARNNIGTSKSENVPCYVKEEKVFTKINFYTKVEKVSIDAVDYDINCVKLDGEMDFISLFGLTGYFEGWFTNDEAAIPIIAKMHVIIGNITLELKEWKRVGWTPPKFNN